MTAPTNRLIEIATAMAQDLREYADAAEEAGERIEATEQLLEEFDAWMRNEFDAPRKPRSGLLREGKMRSNLKRDADSGKAERRPRLPPPPPLRYRGG